MKPSLLFFSVALVMPLAAWQLGPRPTRAYIGPAPLDPRQIADLERQVAAEPQNLDLRKQLLRLYADAGPFSNGQYRAARLSNVEFVVNEFPASPLAGSPLMDVDPGDRAFVAGLWRAQANRFFEDTKVQLNAIRFLQIEQKEQAEAVFQRAIAARPADAELSGHLGFFYAAGLVGADTMDGRVVAVVAESDRNRWSEYCKSRLEGSTSSHVLSGAGFALPNVAMLRTGGGDEFSRWVRYSEELRRRAEALEPAGQPRTMPVEFGMFAAESDAARGNDPQSAPAGKLPPNAVRIGPNVIAANKLTGSQPDYPPLAKQARIQGTVKMSVQIGPDGRPTNIQLVSGHPLLVQAAVSAVQTWTYKPTLLNGSPVTVYTTVDVDFTLSN